MILSWSCCITVSVFLFFFFTIVYNPSKSFFWAYYEYYIQLCVASRAGLASRQPVSCECLSEAALLTPQRQHGSLAQIQCCELKLWRHVGGRSYVVSTFPPSSSSSSPLLPTAAHHTLTSGHPPRGPGGGGWTRSPAHKSGEKGTKATHDEGRDRRWSFRGEGWRGRLTSLLCRLTDQRGWRAVWCRSGHLVQIEWDTKGWERATARQQQRAPVSHAPPCENEPSKNGSSFM